MFKHNRILLEFFGICVDHGGIIDCDRTTVGWSLSYNGIVCRRSFSQINATTNNPLRCCVAHHSLYYWCDWFVLYTLVRTASVIYSRRMPSILLLVCLLWTDGVRDPYCTPSIIVHTLILADDVPPPYWWCARSVLHSLHRTSYTVFCTRWGRSPNPGILHGNYRNWAQLLMGEPFWLCQ